MVADTGRLKYVGGRPIYPVLFAKSHSNGKQNMSLVEKALHDKIQDTGIG